MRLFIIFLFSISSLCVYSQEKNNIDELINKIEQNDAQSERKKKKEKRIISRKTAWRNRVILPGTDYSKRLFLGITSIQGNQNSPSDITSKYEVGYFDGNSNYFGFQFGFQEANLNYDGDIFNNSAWNFIYGRSLTDNGSVLDAFFLTLAIGYHATYFDTTESFGPFYDFEGKFYYAYGTKIILIEFESVKALFEYNIDYNNNTTIGLGLSINL